MRVCAACLVLFAACAGEEDPHELGACDARWNTPGVEPQRCEAACEKPRDATGPECYATFCVSGDGRTIDPNNTSCPATFEIGDGRGGCCHPGGTADAPLIQFWECIRKL